MVTVGRSVAVATAVAVGATVVVAVGDGAIVGEIVGVGGSDVGVAVATPNVGRAGAVGVSVGSVVALGGSGNED